MVIPDLPDNIKKLYKMMSPCVLCPRECKAERIKGEKGFCQAGKMVKISSNGPHHGEEPPISGTNGSGTIFFSYCTMACVFCQNFQISQLHNGYDVNVVELAKIMLNLEKRKCHNVNLVTPTHFIPQIAHAISIAKANGLSIPILFNDSGYEKVEVLRLLDGLIDIYMPDAKYDDNQKAKENSYVVNYVENNRLSLLEMYRQVGNLQLEDGIANDHHNGRCDMLPYVPGVTDEYANPKAGQEWFDGLSEQQQRDLMGPGKYEAYKEGAFEFSQLSKFYEDPVYGTMRVETPLNELIKESE
ncbi:MAG: radical SAM protein [Caldiserica bacterium]|nr:radical SAM protein [Caldisericota bacterium]